METVYIEIKPPRLLAEAENAARQDGAVNKVDAIEDYIRKNTIRLGFVSATRRQSYKRGDMMQAAQEWILRESGAESLAEIEFRALPSEVFITWLAAWQAADIMGALVSHENWSPPPDVEGWAEVPDYIFNPALAMAWELNPQWQVERSEAMEANF